MLAPRKGLLSNLNHVHLQHVSLGVHLSLRADLKEGPLTKDPGIEGVTRSPHRWKEETNTSQVDPNSNDPSVPCLCCDEHSKQVDTCNYNCQNNVELITNDVELQSPCDLPLSPLSPSSPSTDSSSSSDFTLDDSPVSMYYKEFCQDDLESPDQQPDIIPLDAANEDIISSTLQNSMWLSPDSVSSSPSCDEIRPNTPEPITPENLESHNKHTKDAELLHFWETNSALDANCNTLPGSQPLAIFSPSSGCLESEMVNEQWEQKMTHAEVRPDNAGKDTSSSLEDPSLVPWPQEVEEEFLPGLSFPKDVSSQSPKKTITSFHELAQRRRRSGGGQPATQVKKDRSDWLIMFSPDTEQPPVNELTASVFYNSPAGPNTLPLSVGKEVTTFKELRYRNNLIKQCSQQGKGQTMDIREPQKSADEGKEEHCSTMRKEEHPYPAAQGKHTHYQVLGGEEVPYQGVREFVSQQQATEEHGPLVSATQEEQSDKRRHRTGKMQATTQEDPNQGQEDKQLGRGPVKITSKVWIRGRADGGDKRWRDAGLCKPLMEESGEDSILRAKKGFLVAISSSVDKIICHFNSSRNLVQKARLGDSRLSPELGYLILNGLCPSLYDLLRDGIKPFQKDVILGRRRLSPWSLVEASVKPGTAQASFHNLLGIVKSLSQLRDPQRKFNAFIFGLLNTKKLDIWVSQLHQNYDLSSMFFVPTGFVALAAASHPELCDELLLTLQPLSALTFHLDLLFEHHHLSLPDSPVSPQPLSHGPGGLDTLGFSLQHLLHWGGRLAHNLAHGAEQNLSPTGSNHPSTLNRHVAADPSPQEFSTLQNDTPSPPSDTTHDLLSSPDRTPQDLDVSVRSLQDPSPSPLEISQDSCSPDRESPQNSLSPAIEDPQDSFPNNTQMDSSPPKELFCPSPSPLTNTSQDLLPPHSETPQDSSSSWWEHLSQASRVYMPTNIESFPFTRWSKLRSWGTSEREQENPAARGESAKATGDISKTLPEGNLPNTRKVIDPTNEHKVSDLDQSEATLSKNEGSRNTGGHLTQKNDGCTSNSDNAKTGPLSPNTGGLGMWLGHLFGANPTSSREMETKNVKSRRPSTWLQPNVNVLNLLRKPSTPVTTKTLPQEAEQPQTTKKPERSLRALCDHSSSDEAQLNFRKGEVLQLLGTVDEDWIRCQRGSDTGLVPVGYTSLIL